MNPKFPIYIVSKGRWENNMTSIALEKINVPYFIIVDKDEYENYCKFIDKSKVLIQPDKYREEYDMFWKDDSKVTGPGAARNFAWDHSIKKGFKFHWVMDDNIAGFMRFNKNIKSYVSGGTVLKIMEDFVLRYENVAIAGPNYDYFVVDSVVYPPFVANTRVYSCLFIRNDIPFRWRGRYNEDTDLCLRVLKAGWCTIQFNAFLQDKTPTQLVKGGNTEQFYDKEGTLKKSKMLQEMHPDVCTVVWKFHRIHHQINYKPFRKNLLVKKSDVIITEKIDEYGLRLVNRPKTS